MSGRFSGTRRSVTGGLALFLSACAGPRVQGALIPPDGFTGPAIETEALVMHDGARLPYLVWRPEAQPPTAVIVALHGMNDHRTAFRLAGPWWAQRGLATYAYDQRGFGRAPGRGTWAGPLMQEDLRTVVALVRQAHPGLPVVVVGESMGGAVAITAFASDRPPAADRLVLLAPAVWGWSSQAPLNRAALWVAARAMGGRAVQAPDWAVRNIRASDNLPELIRNGRDPDFIRSTRFDALSGLVDLMEDASLALGRTRVPTLLIYGAHDQIIEKRPMRLALERAGSRANLRTAWHANGWHLLNRDLQAPVVYADVEAFVRDPDAPLPSGAPEVLPRLTASR
jgi:alpha-beta hydrolase superfamily lysophospholipase